MTVSEEHQVPAVLRGLLEAMPEVGSHDQAYPFITVDHAGFPHAALLSRAEMRISPDGSQVYAAVRSRRARANLLRDGRAMLIAVDSDTAHYVKMVTCRTIPAEELLACAFTVVEHRADSLGIPLMGMRYVVTEEISRVERWDRTVTALALLD